jgi:hypothetical protein
MRQAPASNLSQEVGYPEFLLVILSNFQWLPCCLIIFYKRSKNGCIFFNCLSLPQNKIARPPCYCWLYWHNVHTKFRENWSTGSKFERGTQTQTHAQTACRASLQTGNCTWSFLARTHVTPTSKPLSKLCTYVFLYSTQSKFNKSKLHLSNEI